MVVWAGARDEFGIPQGFPEVKELGWSGLFLQSCPPVLVTAGKPWAGATDSWYALSSAEN